MSTHRVVEKLDVVEHICPGFVSCFVNVLLDSLGLQQREKALGHCIVMAIAAPANAGFQIVIVKELAPSTMHLLSAPSVDCSACDVPPYSVALGL